MGIFDTFNSKVGGLGLPGGLGLMTTGLGLLEGSSPLQAIQAGLGTYGSLTEDEERRRRKEAVAKLGAQYANDPRIKAIIDADPQAGLSLISQLEADKRRYRAPRAKTTLEQRQELAGALGYKPDSAEYRNILETGSSAGPDYGMREAADGYVYFTSGPNKGQRVFPDVTAAPKAPKFREFDGDLYQETNNGLSLVQKGTPDTKFQTVGDKVYRVEGGNLIEVLDNTKPKDPVLREVNGELLDVTDINNPKVIAGTPSTPNPNVVNFLATAPTTIGNKTYNAGDVFAIDINDKDALGSALEAGAYTAPTKTESTVTNTPANAAAAQTVLTEATTSAAENPTTIDIVQAAGKDVGGVVSDVLNTAAGYLGTTFNQTREEQIASVNAANNSIREPLVKALSRSGSVYTQKQIAELLPSPNDNNERFIQKAEALMPTLEAEMRYQAMKATTSQDGVEVEVAKNELQQMAKYVEGMKAAIKKYRENKPTGGVSATQKAADAILSGGRN